MSERHDPAVNDRHRGQSRSEAWADLEDEDDEASFKPLSRDEVRALVAANPVTSPWRVVAVQGVIGGLMAAVVWLLTRQQNLMWSVLYGAAAVVVPAALMARGMTSRLSSVAPGVSAVSFMLWEFGKIGVSVVMLMLAPKLVPGLSWPAMLVALIVCINVYWVALSWRGRRKS
jgi:ATP synthase protein I